MTAERVTAIETILRDAFEPTFLQVKDQSHLHAGHEGAKDGRGHFDVTIEATQLQGLSRVECHRRIYEALGDMMTTDIHALRIKSR